MARKRIGELLLERGVIDRAQLEAGLAHHRSTGQRLGQALVSLGALTEDALVGVLAQALGIPSVDLRRVQPDRTALGLIRARFCEQHDLFPYGLEQSRGRKTLLVAMADPLNLAAIEEVEFTINLKVQPRIAPLSSVRAAILKHLHRVDASTATRAPVELPVTPGQRAAVASGPGEFTLEETDEAAEEAIIIGEELPGVGEPEPWAGRAASASPRAPVRRSAAGAATPVASPTLQQDLDFLFGRDPEDRVETLERRFWALLRVLTKKGLVRPEELAAELDLDEA